MAELDEMFDPPSAPLPQEVKEFQTTINQFNKVHSPSLLFVKLATAFVVLVILHNIQKVMSKLLEKTPNTNQVVHNDSNNEHNGDQEC